MHTDTKACRDCGETKPREDFSRQTRAKDGLQNYCKPCTAHRNREARRANPAKTREVDRMANLARKRKREADPQRDPDIWKKEYARQVALHGLGVLNERRRARDNRSPEDRRGWYREYRQKNLDKMREYWRRSKYAQGDEETAVFVEAVYRDPCAYCGGPGGTIDHIVPRSSDGASDWTNYTGACLSCNSGKCNKPFLFHLLTKETA